MITIHAQDNIHARIKPLGYHVNMLNLARVASMYTDGKHYVKIANLPRIYSIAGSTGDTVVVILNGGNVVTVMLSNDNQRWDDGAYHVHLQD